MYFKIFPPHRALSAFVNHIMVYDLSVGKDAPLSVCAFPPLPENFLYIYVFESPTVEYFATGKIETLPSSVIIGQQTTRVSIRMPRQNVCVRVGFQPGGLFRLLGMPLSTYFLDKALDTNFLFKNELQEVRERLQEATSFVEMKNMVEDFLLKKSATLKPPLPIDKALTALVKSGGLLSVENLAYQSCVSLRQLERQFHQRVGVSPKFFIRLNRFSKAWIIKERQPDLSWTNIAYLCGYYDQMHLIRDFKEFVGVPPSVIEADLRQSALILKTPLHF